MDWLQAHEKAGKGSKKVTKPSPAELPVGKARVLVLETCTYDNRLVHPGEELILKACRKEFPRTPLDKKFGYPSVVINGEKFERRFRDSHMEYLGEIRVDQDGNETFIEYHGEPVTTQTAQPQGNSNPNQNQGQASDKNKV